MPWTQVTPMDQRFLFITDYLRQPESVTDLCRRYGISRKTGYKWIARYEAEGPSGLQERSRRPHHSPTRTKHPILEAILQTRKQHPSWGAKKLLAFLKRNHPSWELPARRTISDILKRHGLVLAPGRRRNPGHPGRPRTPMSAPNVIWTADFKGQFRTRDGVLCYPLTVADGYSRFLLGCEALLHPSFPATQAVFERLFREYRLPQIIRTDNGTPSASRAIGRISQLPIWWVRLGIFPERIDLGQPQQNGRHERMHRTLRAEATRPAAANRAAQQRRFDKFRRIYNWERPHEALGQETPASHYARSARALPDGLPKVEYPGHYEVKFMNRGGGFRWRKKGLVHVSHSLGGEYIGLEPIDHGLWAIYFGPLRLGWFHERAWRVEIETGTKWRKRMQPMSSD
jgi:putative transposase